MIGFDHGRLGLPADLPGTGRVAAALIDAGAPVDGLPGDFETPLITAASYGDLEVAQVLIVAGADIEARATDAGAVPGARKQHTGLDPAPAEWVDGRHLRIPRHTEGGLASRSTYAHRSKLA